MALLKVVCWAPLIYYKNPFSAWQISGYDTVSSS